MMENLDQPTTSFGTPTPPVTLRYDVVGTIKSISFQNLKDVPDQKFVFKKFNCFHCKKLDKRSRRGRQALNYRINVQKGFLLATGNEISSVKEIIKDQEDQCTIQVVINNRGPKAMESSIYGGDVTVIWKIRKDESKSLSIVAENGKVVSTDKKDLKKLLYSFKIHPAAFLLCDGVEKILALSERGKYKLFLKLRRLNKTVKHFDSVLDPEGQLENIAGNEKWINLSETFIERLKKDMELKKKVEDYQTRLDILNMWLSVDNHQSTIVADEKSIEEFMTEVEKYKQLSAEHAEDEYRVRKEMDHYQEVVDQSNFPGGILILERNSSDLKLQKIIQDLMLVSFCETACVDKLEKIPPSGAQVKFLLISCSSTDDVRKLQKILQESTLEKLLGIIEQRLDESIVEFGSKTVFFKRLKNIRDLPIRTEDRALKFCIRTEGLEKLMASYGFVDVRKQLLLKKNEVEEIVSKKSALESASKKLIDKVKTLENKIVACEEVKLELRAGIQEWYPDLSIWSANEIRSKRNDVKKCCDDTLKQISNGDKTSDEMDDELNGWCNDLKEIEAKLVELKKDVPNAEGLQSLREETKKELFDAGGEVLNSNFQKIFEAVSVKAYLEIDDENETLEMKQVEMTNEEGLVKKTAHANKEQLSLGLILAILQSSKLPFYVLSNLEAYFSPRQIKQLLDSALLSARAKASQMIFFTSHVPTGIQPHEIAVFEIENLEGLEVAGTSSEGIPIRPDLKRTAIPSEMSDIPEKRNRTEEDQVIEETLEEAHI